MYIFIIICKTNKLLQNWAHNWFYGVMFFVGSWRSWWNVLSIVIMLHPEQTLMFNHEPGLTAETWCNPALKWDNRQSKSDIQSAPAQLLNNNYTGAKKYLAEIQQKVYGELAKYFLAPLWWCIYSIAFTFVRTLTLSNFIHGLWLGLK